MNTINLNDDQLRSVIGAAILQQLTPEKRDELLTNAVASLLSPTIERQKPGGSYYDKEKVSQLQVAFERAVDVEAGKIVREMLASDSGLRQKLEGVVRGWIVDAVRADAAVNGQLRRSIIESLARALEPSDDDDD